MPKSNRGQNQKKPNNSPKRRGRSVHRKVNTGEQNNFQDKFAKSEFKKGMKFATDVLEERDARNNPQWYFKDKNILDSVASFAYSHPLGMDIGFNDMIVQSTSNYIAQGTTSCSIPGVLAIQIGITPGYSVDAQSPINLGAQDLYSFVRYKNSGAANYDPPDLMMYIMGLDSLYAAWNWLKRIYGYASTYSSTNKYKPQSYAFIDGIDLENVYDNLADFRAYLNMAANRISAFACPATMSYNVRHSWLFSNIYTDADTIKAQEYFLTPKYFYKFAETTQETGTSLEIVTLPTCPTTPASVFKFGMSYDYAKEHSQLWTTKQLKSMLNTMINAMQYSEDAGIMSGDIIKAFGNNLFTLSTFDADYRVDAVYSEEVLMQIENATLSDLTPVPITQDPNTNFIVYDPSNTASIQTNGVNGAFLNFHKSAPTPEDVMVASRLTTAIMTIEGKLHFQSVGSEVMTGCYGIYFAQAQEPTRNGTYVQGAPLHLYGVDLGHNSDLTVGGNSRQIFRMWIWSAFDWAPALRMAIWDNDSSLPKPVAMILPELRDWDVYTKLSYNNLESLHTLALLTEFNVPN